MGYALVIRRSTRRPLCGRRSSRDAPGCAKQRTPRERPTPKSGSEAMYVRT